MPVDKDKAVAIGQAGVFLISVNYEGQYVNRSSIYGILSSREDGREDEYEEMVYDHLEQYSLWKASSDPNAIAGMEDITTKVLAEVFGKRWEAYFLEGEG